MEKKLILQHLLKREVVRPSKRDEVLNNYPSDAASSVAVVVVSSFDASGAGPSLSTPFSIDWTMQCVAHCLSLPTVFSPSLYNSLAIFGHWLNANNFFSDNETWNEYAREIFMYLSQIFEVRFDGGDSTERVKLIDLLMNQIDRYQRDLGAKFDDETWNILTRILIGACDFLTLDESREILHQTAETPQELLKKCFLLMYRVICNSQLTSTVIWKVFFSFCEHWKTMKIFLISWSMKVCELYSEILKQLFAQNQDETKLKLLGFQLHQFIEAIDLDVVIHDAELFYVLAQLVKQLYTISRDFARAGNNLYRPLFPSDVFFELFGKWCFVPFTVEYTKGHSSLIKTLMRIGGNWHVNEKWTKVLVSTLLGAMKYQNSETNKSIVKKGHTFVTRFNSKEIIESFSSLLETMGATDIPKNQFWKSCASLLVAIGETGRIPESVLGNFLHHSCNTNADLDVLYLLMHKNWNAFVKEVSLLVDIANSLETSRTVYEKLPNRGYTFIEILTVVCAMVAAAPPFLKLSETVDLLLKLLDCAQRNKHAERFIEAFVTMVACLAKWDDSVFKKEFIVPFLDFLVDLHDNGYMDVTNIARLVEGRPLNRSLQDFDTSNPLVSFVVASQSIVTVYGDEKRGESFILHIRDSRGFFVWEVSDILPNENFHIVNAPETLPEVAHRPPSQICSDLASEFTNFSTALEKMSATKCFDESYTSNSKHTEESHIQIHKLQAVDKLSDEEVMQLPWLHYRLRHKSVDFLVQNGIAPWVQKIDGDAKEVLREFDNIKEAAALPIPVYHVTEAGITTEDTPLFKRFISLVGTGNRESITEVQMGLLTLQFSKTFEHTGFISVVFSESPLDLNKRHSTFPRSELTFFVEPHDQKFYRVTTISREPIFWSIARNKRIISNEHLASCICMASFDFVLLKRRDLIFEKDEERARFIQQIKTTPTSVLSITGGYSLESLRSQL